MADLALELHDVSLRYRSFAPARERQSGAPALDRCSIRLHVGQCAAVVGEPGAGKTTLLLCASGILNPDGGRVRAVGAEYVSRTGTAHPYLGVRAALEFAASLLELSGRVSTPDVETVLRRTGLQQVERVRIGQLSPALRARASVAHALLTNPRVLCLDDILDPLDAAGQHSLAMLLEALAADGLAVLLSARDEAAVAGVTSRVYRLTEGRLAVSLPSAATLEIDVDRPARAATALAHRIPSVRRRGRALRVPLERISAEEVLSTCVSLGIAVQGSRVVAARRARVAEPAAARNDDAGELPSPAATS